MVRNCQDLNYASDLAEDHVEMKNFKADAANVGRMYDTRSLRHRASKRDCCLKR
jgi:hypothetical protein